MTRFIDKIRIPTFLNTKSFDGNNLAKYMYTGLEQMIDVRGQIINYLKVGNGEQKVLCFPGMLGTIWSDFGPQIKGMDREKLTLIAWDPPGFGGSRPPKRCFDSQFYERDAKAAFDFMMRLNIKKFSIMGWSDGGISSLILAGKHPQNVEKLIVWGVKSYILQEEIEQYENFRDICKWSNSMKEPYIDLYTEEGLEKLWGARCDAVAGMFRKGGDICNCCLHNIECPTLILYGDNDPMVCRSHPHHLFSNIKNSKLYKFCRGKHNVHLKFSDEFNKVATDFLLSKECPPK